MNTFSLQPRGSVRRIQYPQTAAASWGDTPAPGDLMPLGLELWGGGLHAGGWPDSSSAAGSPPPGLHVGYVALWEPGDSTHPGPAREV